MYKRVYIDLYVENKYGSDVVHTIDLVDIESPEDDPIVQKSIVEIYTYMKKINNSRFSFIRVGGITELDSDEEELFCVYKRELVRDYGVKIMEYSSIWTDMDTYV